MSWPAPVTLEGSIVTVTPLTQAHAQDRRGVRGRRFGTALVHNNPRTG